MTIKQHLHILCTALPLWIISADLVYMIFNNLRNDLIIPAQIKPQNGFPIAPEIAFNWLQVTIGVSAAIFAIWGLLSVLRLNRRVIAGVYTPNKGFWFFGCLLTIFFTLPTVWEMFCLIIHLAQGKLAFYPSAEYIIVALSLPWAFVLTFKRLVDNRRLYSSSKTD